MDPRFQEMGTEQELAVILSHYESNFVFDIVKEQLIRSTTMGASSIMTPPNVVAAWEQNFKAIMDQYGAEGATKIQEVRQETYNEIITIICNHFNLQFTIADVDLYTAAYSLYDFFICNFSNNIITFLAKYIYKERTAIYEGLGLSEMKKNKDNSTLYGKRIYKDIKLAVINANIVMILDNITGMEFDFPNILTTIIDGKNMSRYMVSLIADKGSFYTDIMVPTIKANLADYVTGTRFKLQELAVSHDQIIYSNTANEEIATDLNTENTKTDEE